MTHTYLSPGWTFTGMTAQSGAEKPAGAWSAEETVLYMLDRVRQGDFYILCPDNETRPAVDALRIMWAAGGECHIHVSIIAQDWSHQI
jgi:hypothetical protein